MKWQKCEFQVLPALVLVLTTAGYVAGQNSTSLFSTALRNSRVYDTSLQSSIIRLIRELMLTPKVYESMGNSERRADSGRVFFPTESTSSSSSLSPSTSFRPSARIMPTLETEATPTHRGLVLAGRSIPGSGGFSGMSRPGKVERVPRPIIINGNSAAFNAPRYNRMIEGPAPTIGTTVKLPQPSVIMSQPLRILEGDRDSRGRSLKEIDVQGVRVIVGQRVPDDPEDKLFTWRNGRVIKGMFFPNEPSNSRPMNQEQNNDISKLPVPSSVVVGSSYNF